ncbi:[histone H3]-lysine(4) N-trimethyltransferase [Ranunculus cassubicifolius]
MSDLTNLFFNPSSSSQTPFADLYSISVNWDDSIVSFCSDMVKKVPLEEKSKNWGERLRFPIVNKVRKNGGSMFKKIGDKPPPPLSSSVKRGGKQSNLKSFDERVKDWVKKKVESGVPEIECRLPFLDKSPKLVECPVCSRPIYSDEVLCSVSSCRQKFHLKCAKEKLGFLSPKTFKCRKHVCFLCKQKASWHCVRCDIAAHSRCAPWPERVRYIGQSNQVICWRHPTDWRLYKKPDQSAVPTSNIEEIFFRLPIPYTMEEFSVDSMRKDMMEKKKEPDPYERIRRNVYLAKKKRNFMDGSSGCTNCDASGCHEDCVCRVQSISCSKDCVCSVTCTNRPFRKEKKIKVVETVHCGWGVEAAEPIKEGEFVIEYVGEVIDDVECTQRFWQLKKGEEKNFYLCEIRKDFTIDATKKGNFSRFVNHSCDPNCKMEKWEVDGETRLGIFATRSIQVGEALTYNYRFVCFGTEVPCMCGAANCQGTLGVKKKPRKVNRATNLKWKSKRRRSLKVYYELTRHL